MAVYQRVSAACAGPDDKKSVAGKRPMGENFQGHPERRLRARTAAAIAAVAFMCGGVLYNTLIAGPGRPGYGDVAAAPGATTKLVVDAGDGAALNTVTLRYDPMVEAVQRELAAAGLYDGAVDGVAGRKTKLAIEAYEQQNGMEVTGLAAQSLIEHIRYTRAVASAADYTGSVSPAATPVEDEAVKRVQTGLSELGYDAGDADGAIGGKTEEAIKQFQRDRGLAQSGEITEDMMDELAKLSGQSALTAE